MSMPFSKGWLPKSLLISASVYVLSACVSPLMTSKDLKEKSLPNVQVPTQFQAADSQSSSGLTANDAWLGQFNDPELNALATQALKNNPSLAIFAARRSQAQSLMDSAGGAFYPGVNAIGNLGGKAGSSGSGLTGYYIGANWELDLWGRVRTQMAATTQTSRAINADQDAAQLSLLASLAKSVWLARVLTEQARLSEENVFAAETVASLTQVREKIGASSTNELLTTQGSVAQLQELAIATSVARDQSLRAVQVLIGQYPSAKPLQAIALPSMPAAIDPGLPMDLLERRPDVVAAEARVNSAFYTADEKRLTRLPKISLSAGFAYIDSQVFSLINGASTSFGFGASVAMPIFQGGAIEAQIAYQNAEARAALANYGKTILSAFNEAENGINADNAWRSRSALLQTQLDLQTRLMKNTTTEFTIGKVDQRQVQQQLIKTNLTKISWNQGRLDALAQRVNLYLALGGPATN